MRRDACLGRYREFPKFPESKTPEGKGASAIKRLANDLVRFGKISILNRARIHERKGPSLQSGNWRSLSS